MNWTDFFTAIVALYGAALSTYIFVVEIRSKKRQISIKLSHAVIFSGPNVSPSLLQITVANPGNRTVTINTPSLLLPNKKSLVFPQPKSDVSFPHELLEGKNCAVWTDMGILKHELKAEGYSGKIKVIAEVTDATDKKYRSKKSFSIIVPIES